MEKNKRWHLWLIIAVSSLTLFNVLPTLFFYARQPGKLVDEKTAGKVTESIIARVSDMKLDAKDWLKSYGNTIKKQPKTIEEVSSRTIALSFNSTADANEFAHDIARAGELIPFAPAKLAPSQVNEKTVFIERRIPIDLSMENFKFVKKFKEKGVPSEEYREVVIDRLVEICNLLIGSSQSGKMLLAISESNPNSLSLQTREMILSLAEQLNEFNKKFKDESLSKRYFAHFAQVGGKSRTALIEAFIPRLNALKEKISAERISKTNSAAAKETIALLKEQEDSLRKAGALIAAKKELFTGAPISLTRSDIEKKLSQHKTKQTLSLEKRNPFFKDIEINWALEEIILKTYPEVQKSSFVNEQIALLSRKLQEKVIPYGSSKDFVLSLPHLAGSQSLLVLDLKPIIETEVANTKEMLKTAWKPKHIDLDRESFPIHENFVEKHIPGITVYAPSTGEGEAISGFNKGSIYVIVKGLQTIYDRSSSSQSILIKDQEALSSLLIARGFYPFPGSIIPGEKYKKDLIFVLDNHIQDLIAATREDFSVRGSGRFAILEFTDIHQRILAENRIGTRIQEDLLAWKEQYNLAQMGKRELGPKDVAQLTKNPLWSNIKLSTHKYFHGDTRKILKWATDLAGGKELLIALFDANDKPVTNETDIHQAINELHRRVNTYGVSEVSIRKDNDYISLTFPGSQGINSEDLVKASSMFFHIVNEKFAKPGDTNVNKFLQDVWNEALLTEDLSAQKINQIARDHLQNQTDAAAHALYEKGLRLSQLGQVDESSSDFNTEVSRIAVLRDPAAGQTHPLLIVFKNHALKGADLQDVHSGVDPSQGNFLSFGVKREAQDGFYAWTKEFSTKENKARMAVILNGTVISSPSLEAALRDRAMITGSFSTSEIHRLESDLKAGSLSFTPKILSEKNISPELGGQERSRAILATIFSLVLVIGIMVCYYRFWGIVASCAVLFNLLVMWAALQNIGAALSLAGIAGIILTMGMAVDANVLVFERMREEFKKTKRLIPALHAGHKMAFSAILDSNITTVIAAIILLNFDSGPIKGFAITLIIGIVSSMFTALFMTRFFFTKWAAKFSSKKGKTVIEPSLGMANWIKPSQFNFLKSSKIAVFITLMTLSMGFLSLMKDSQSIFGMDFTGGSALTIEVKNAPKSADSYKAQVEKVLSGSKIEVRELSRESELRLFFSPAQLVNVKNELESGLHPEVSWTVSKLKNAGIDVTVQNSSDISGQMSTSMRNSALIGLALALLGIMIYITIRFEFKYAISATLCTLHDVLFTLGAIGILYALGVNIQIDLHTVAALMTIIGYSLNDTIIVFDRIREDVEKNKEEKSFGEVINQAINTTLSRTLMTSITTLLVLLPLIFLGGSTVFGFALVMSIGVIFGTLSSLFIATPLLHFFESCESKKTRSRIN